MNRADVTVTVTDDQNPRTLSRIDEISIFTPQEFLEAFQHGI